MVNVPNAQKFQKFSRPAAYVRVDLGPDGGDLGDVEEQNTDRIVCTSIRRREGGVMELEFDYVLPAVDERLVDMWLMPGNGKLVYVYTEDASGNEILLGWGEVLQQKPEVTEQSETLKFVASVTNPHFGTPLYGPHVWNPVQSGGHDGDPLETHLPIVFNPEIDGVVTANQTNADHDTLGHRLWIDPESVRTSRARTDEQDGMPAAMWYLEEAVYTLCKLQNPDESFIKNPIRSELATVFNGESPLRNFYLPTGQYLRENLNTLLKPHGYSWYLKPTVNQSTDEIETFIKIFKLGTGRVRTVYQPRPGDSLDPAGHQNCLEWELDEGLDELRNKVTALGALIEREITVNMQRGWPSSQDSLKLEQLAHDKDFLKYPNAWRLWVGNEAGDWNDTRTEITEALDLSDIIGSDAPKKRRPFKHCVTYAARTEGEDEHRRHQLVEYKVKPEGDQETITFTMVGSPSSSSWALYWGGSLVGTYGNATTAATIAGDLIGLGVDVDDYSGGPISSSPIVITLAAGVEAPQVYIDASLTGGDNPGVSVASSRWKPVPGSWGANILDQQMGVYFSGDKAVEDLAELGDYAAVRVTGTISGDTRLKGTAAKQDSSSYAREHEIVMDVADRFFDRAVQATGEFASVLSGTGKADIRDDQSLINTFAEKIRATEDAMNLQAKISLTNLRSDWDIGQLIHAIGDRNVSLNRKAYTAPTKQYVQAVEIEMELQPRQRTIVIAHPLDQSEAEEREFERRHKRVGQRARAEK